MTDDNDALLADLRHICGQRRALTAVSGRCSASTAALLRNIRNNRLFRPLVSSWEEFCACRIHVSRRHADRIIALLDEFGPAYFELAELTGVTADQYRQIHPVIQQHRDCVTPDGLSLIPERVEEIAEAVDRMLGEAEAAAPPRTRDRSVVSRVDALHRSAARLAAAYRKILDRPIPSYERHIVLASLRKSIAVLTAVNTPESQQSQ